MDMEDVQRKCPQMRATFHKHPARIFVDVHGYSWMSMNVEGDDCGWLHMSANIRKHSACIFLHIHVYSGISKNMCGVDIENVHCACPGMSANIHCIKLAFPWMRMIIHGYPLKCADIENVHCECPQMSTNLNEHSACKFRDTHGYSWMLKVFAVNVRKCPACVSMDIHGYT